MLAVPTDHALAAQAKLPVANLSGATLITYPPMEGPYFNRLITGLIHSAGIVPCEIQYITQTHSILALVGAGLGVALVPKAAERFSPPGVVFRPLQDADGIRAELMLAWRAKSKNPACHVALNAIANDLD